MDMFVCCIDLFWGKLEYALLLVLYFSYKWHYVLF